MYTVLYCTQCTVRVHCTVHHEWSKLVLKPTSGRHASSMQYGMKNKDWFETKRLPNSCGSSKQGLPKVPCLLVS